MMRRRTFLTTAAAFVAAPAFAQQRATPVRLAVMSGSFTAEQMTESGHPRYRAFFGELRSLGLIEGENLIVERWSNAGRPEGELQDLANRMVASQPDLIFVQASSVVLTVKAATTTIPVVFTGPSPVSYGLVESLERPGGNLTGFATDAGPAVYQKQLQFLREAVPGTEPVAYLTTPYIDSVSSTAAAVRESAKQLGITLITAFVEGTVDEHSIARAFAALGDWPNRVMYVQSATLFHASARAISAEALKASIPATGVRRVLPDNGLLMSYGADFREQYRGAARYVARVAGGEDPAEMPIQQPTVFEFVINLKTARALGIEIPQKLLIQATDLIE